MDVVDPRNAPVVAADTASLLAGPHTPPAAVGHSNPVPVTAGSGHSSHRRFAADIGFRSSPELGSVAVRRGDRSMVLRRGVQLGGRWGGRPRGGE